MTSYEEAMQAIVKATPKPRAARVRLDEALGLALARPVAAPIDLPRFDNSAVDGYAIRSADVRAGGNGAPAPSLRVIGASEAGRPFRGEVGQGQAVRILTGAPVPRGADAIVMQEYVERHDDRLAVQSLPKPGQHIRRSGEDVRQGAQVLAAGAVLRPQEIGLLAALGHRVVPVFSRPTVAVLATGDELQAPGSRLRPGRIYDSNSHLLAALARRAGARPIRLGMARDARASLAAKIRRGLAADALVIAGGVSVGDKDVVREVARRCGIRQIFWQVDIKPGMPVFFGRRRRTLVFGLPGNPVSAFVTFEELVRPALNRLMGRAWRDGYTAPAALATDLRCSTTRRTHFIRVRCGSENGRRIAQPLNGQGSHQLRSLADADGWIRVMTDQGPLVAGTTVMVKSSEVC
jgi:molybdopterin molybdotransferase